MTKKEYNFLYNLFNKDYLLTAMDYNYANEDLKSFVEEHGINFNSAKKIIDKFIVQLKKNSGQ